MFWRTNPAGNEIQSKPIVWVARAIVSLQAGREGGRAAIESYTELKTVSGLAPHRPGCRSDAGAQGRSPGSFGDEESCHERTGASVIPRRSRAIGYGVRREGPLRNHELTGVGVEGLAVHLDGVQGCSAREVRVELLQV